MKKSFSSNVMSYFHYLIDDYKFAIKKIDESESVETEGRIEFETSFTFVTVSSEQWVVGATVGRVKDDKYRCFLDPVTIHDYFTLTESDKKVIYSLDPKDDRKARMIISNIRLSHEKGSFETDFFQQLFNYSIWLRQYAEPFLRGDFSKWLEIYEYKVFSARAAYIRSGRDEFVRTTNSDKKISIFKNNLDYLERLKKEYRKY